MWHRMSDTCDTHVILSMALSHSQCLLWLTCSIIAVFESFHWFFPPTLFTVMCLQLCFLGLPLFYLLLFFVHSLSEEGLTFEIFTCIEMHHAMLLFLSLQSCVCLDTFLMSSLMHTWCICWVGESCQILVLTLLGWYSESTLSAGKFT